MTAQLPSAAKPPRAVPAAPPAGAVAMGQRVQRALQRLVHRMAPPQFTLMNLVADRWRADALGTLVRLGVADAIGQGALSADELAPSLGVDRAALYRLLRALAHDGLLGVDKEGRFSLTAVTAPLRRDHPNTMANVVMELSAPRNARCWSRLPDAIRTGKPTWDGEFPVGMWDWLDAHPEEHAVFHGAMLELTREGAPGYARAFDFGRHGSVVDIGGGTGLLLAQILAVHPGLSGVLMDNPTVLAQSPPVLDSYGVRDRVQTMGGDIFRDTPPAEKGVYLVKNIFHGVSDEVLVPLLKRWREVMRADSRLVAIEIVVPDDGSPYLGFLDLQMLLVAPGGRERTRAEFEALFAAAGLVLEAVLPTASPFSMVVARPR